MAAKSLASSVLPVISPAWVMHRNGQAAAAGERYELAAHGNASNAIIRLSTHGSQVLGQQRAARDLTSLAVQRNRQAASAAAAG
jgi:hypothetical protein